MGLEYPSNGSLTCSIRDAITTTLFELMDVRLMSCSMVLRSLGQGFSSGIEARAFEVWHFNVVDQQGRHQFLATDTIC